MYYIDTDNCGLKVPSPYYAKLLRQISLPQNLRNSAHQRDLKALRNQYSNAIR